MRKCLLLLFVGSMAWISAFSASAFMPKYPDDKEFGICTKTTQDWDGCVVEETQRHLSVVRRQYRTILGEPIILKWHAQPEDNTAVLRDMYESWSAFRHRLCSLANKASIHIEPILKEKGSCNLYYVLHHEDHLKSVIMLMQKTAPKRSSDFDFLYIVDHDAEYANCIREKKNDCLEEELKRSGQEIKDLYKTFSEDEFVGRWNNGPDLKQGNYRDMYDSWVAYRNRMCSLAVWAYKSYYGPNAMSMTQCLQFYNREKLETMENLLVVAHSTLDVDFESDLTPPEEQHEDYEKDDGGTAEGRTITPLERRIDTGNLTPHDVLVKEEKKVEPKPEPQPEEKNKLNIPSWAEE